jgi:release factor glutamine methyltransferase
VVAVDISEEALALAKENAGKLGLSQRVEFVKGDLLGGLGETFEVIVANLPYIGSNDRNTLSREVLRDPEAALFSGPKGDELVRRLIDEVPRFLGPGGILALEIGAGQAEELVGFLGQKNYHDIETKKDYSGIPRFLLARYG